MRKKNVKKRKITYTNGDGVEHTFEDAIEIELGSGSLEDLLEEAFTLNEDDDVIKIKADEIRRYVTETSKSKNVLKRRYEIGKLLQFVDNLKLKGDDSRKEAFGRLFADLNVDNERNPSLAKMVRYPEHMYVLSKFAEEIVFYPGMNWSRWFDILEYKAIVVNRNVLYKIVKECCIKNWPAKILRKELQSLNKIIKKRGHE